MSISPLSSSSSVSQSSGSGEELEPLELQCYQLSEAVFDQNFGNCANVKTDEFMYSPADGDNVLSLNSFAIGDCITMFGIGDDGSLFAWHASTTNKNTDPACFLNDFQNQCDLFHEGTYENLEALSFDIYLVGGKKCGPSLNLCKGLVYINEEFFKNNNFAGSLLGPTDNTGKTFITVNFNTKGELYYYLHD